MVTFDARGHRRRLRERYLRSGLHALHDHEKLELLLTFVILRRDTKPIARDLLKRFGTVGEVLNARPEQLAEVDGVGQQASVLLSLVQEFGAYNLQQRTRRQPALTNRRKVEEYLRTAFGLRQDEYVAVLFLDTANRVINSQVLSEGTVNQCAIYPRELFKKAFGAGAAGIILAHNHPAGSLQPSEADWSLTLRLHELGKLLDLPLLDHLVVCRERVQSLRELPRWPN